jgi:hypothetical protein
MTKITSRARFLHQKPSPKETNSYSNFTLCFKPELPIGNSISDYLCHITAIPLGGLGDETRQTEELYSLFRRLLYSFREQNE